MWEYLHKIKNENTWLFSYLVNGQMRTGKNVNFVYDTEIKVGQWRYFENSWNQKCQLISREKMLNGVWIKNKMIIFNKNLFETFEKVILLINESL